MDSLGILHGAFRHRAMHSSDRSNNKGSEPSQRLKTKVVQRQSEWAAQKRMQVTLVITHESTDYLLVAMVESYRISQ